MRARFSTKPGLRCFSSTGLWKPATCSSRRLCFCASRPTSHAMRPALCLFGEIFELYSDHELIRISFSNFVSPFFEKLSVLEQACNMNSILWIPLDFPLPQTLNVVSLITTILALFVLKLRTSVSVCSCQNDCNNYIILHLNITLVKSNETQLNAWSLNRR